MSKTADSPKKSEEISESAHELAPLPALTNTGVTAVTIGTVLWILGTFVLLLRRDWLDSTGRSNWLTIAIIGIVLGVLGQIYTRHRAARIARGSRF